MAVPGAASAPAVRGPPAPLLCRAPSLPHGLIRSARVGGGLKRPGWCSGGGLGEANEFHGLDSCRDGGRRVPAPWPWKGGSLAAPKAPGPPNLEPKCRGRRSRPPSSKAPHLFLWGGGAAFALRLQTESCAPRAGACSLAWKLLSALPVWLAAVSGCFCGLISLQRSGYCGWKEHVCLTHV